jgi:hypothetical protein
MLKIIQIILIMFIVHFFIFDELMCADVVDLLCKLFELFEVYFLFKYYFLLVFTSGKSTWGFVPSWAYKRRIN